MTTPQLALLVLAFSVFFLSNCEKVEPTNDNQEVLINGGLDELEMYSGDSDQLTAQTISSQNTPSYIWQSSNASIVSVTSDPSSNSVATISGVGNPGQSATITVNDDENGVNASITIILNRNPFGELIDGRDDKTYLTVEIGEQVWMAENMSYDTENGSYYYDDDPNNAIKYGKLYDWYAAMEVCPTGWHLPSFEEWSEMEVAIGMDPDEAAIVTGWRGTEEGHMLKSAHSWANSGSGSDLIGFTALPAGGRHLTGEFFRMGENGMFWTSTVDQNMDTLAWTRGLWFEAKQIHSKADFKPEARSVRCVEDQ